MMGGRMRHSCSRLLIVLLLATALVCPSVTLALQNSATGSSGGISLDTSSATVNLTLTSSGPAVDSVFAEINPGSVLALTACSSDLSRDTASSNFSDANIRTGTRISAR